VTAVEFGLLGSIEARIDGDQVELGHARQRHVLAALLVDADRLVPIADLPLASGVSTRRTAA
jgi:hypothetical protein